MLHFRFRGRFELPVFLVGKKRETRLSNGYTGMPLWVALALLLGAVMLWQIEHALPTYSSPQKRQEGDKNRSKIKIQRRV